MRRLTTKSMIGGALIALLGTALSATAAQASPSSPRPCTAADFVTGACLTAVVTDPTTPAEMAAVRQAVASQGLFKVAGAAWRVGDTPLVV